MAGTDDFKRRRNALGCLVVVWSLIATGISGAGILYLVGSFQGTLVGVRLEELGTIVAVPVFVHTLGPGTMITREDVTEIEIAEEYLSLGAIRSLQDVVGRTTGERVLAGDLVRSERLLDPEMGTGLNALVPPGMRAQALNLSTEQAVAGFIVPGNRVDVIGTLPPRRGEKSGEVKTLASGVAVLAVDEYLSETSVGEKVMVPQVTLALDPRNAERLAHVSAIGHLTLTLRSGLDFVPASRGELVSDRIARDSRQMTIPELKARFTYQDLEQMYTLLEEFKPEPQPDIAPRLLRDIDAQPAASGAEAQGQVTMTEH
jgi:Flp pilus assembly protein CpaB